MIGRTVLASGLLTLAAVALTFGVAAPPERCPSVTATDLRDGAGAAVDWLIANQAPDGTWLYEYDRRDDRATDDYNLVRHAGVVSSLSQAAARGYPGAAESAERGLAWARDHLVERDGWIGFTDSGTVQTGANALLLAALAERRQATGDGRDDELMAGLARFLVAQTEPSGALLAYYDLGPDRPRAGTYSIYYTGEAHWALATMHLQFPTGGWGATADRMLHYMATVRDDAEGIWPPLADHWSGYGLATTAEFPERVAGRPLTDDELDMVRRQGGLIGQRVRSISQRFGPWGVVVRGTFTPRGGGYGVFGEGLTGLWRASRLDERLAPERATLAERATCIAALALEAQATDEDAAAFPDPTKVAGAWFIDDVTRMDDQQHALSALMMTTEILELTPDTVPDALHPAPMWLLWYVVLVATVNPVRVAVGAPVSDRRQRTLLAASGAAIAGAAVLAVGSLSGAVIDLFDTSRPALRLGAAALCALSAAIDLARPTPGSTATLPGHRAALVPIAIPLVARPAVVVAGWSVVADHSVPFLLATLITLVALTAVAALVVAPSGEEDSGVSRTLALAASRLVAATAFLGGLLLVADAVFDL